MVFSLQVEPSVHSAPHLNGRKPHKRVCVRVRFGCYVIVKWRGCQGPLQTHTWVPPFVKQRGRRSTPFSMGN